jgi:hypothetical protein
MVRAKQNFNFLSVHVENACKNKGIAIGRANFGFRALSFYSFLFLSKTKGNWTLKNSKLTVNGITLTFGHKVGCKKKGIVRAMLINSEESNVVVEEKGTCSCRKKRDDLRMIMKKINKWFPEMKEEEKKQIQEAQKPEKKKEPTIKIVTRQVDPTPTSMTYGSSSNLTIFDELSHENLLDNFSQPENIL